MPLNLFLSSTVRDLEEHRLEIQEVCLQKADTACFLSEEDWSGGYDDTVASCEQRVLASDAFLLIVAHFYGSVPPGYDRSITHIEFDGALTRWAGNKFPPMAVMMPRPGSDIDTELQDKARALLQENAADLAQHTKSITAFRDTVGGSWRRVKYFKTKGDLREWVISICKDWRGFTPMAAARGLVETEPATDPQVTDEQLGAIGREPQIQAIRAVLTRLADHPDVPAVAFLIPGDESSGQRAGALRLIKVALRQFTTRQRLVRLPVSAPNAAALSSWIGQSMGLADVIAIQTPEQLAARVATELKRQPLCFALDRIGDVPGGIAGFREGFWTPFHDALRTLRAAQKFTNRLVAIVADYAGDPPGAGTALVTADRKGVVADYTGLIRLPLLDEFDRDAILTWFDDMNIPDMPAGRRAALADRALLGGAGIDPNPLRVFERLRGETLWPAPAGGLE